jgi:hypothetical protein
MTTRPQPEPIDLSEKGGGTSSDRRLFMQFHAFHGCADTAAAIEAMEMTGTQGALYEDVNDPLGLGVATFTEDPDDFVGPIRRLYQGEPFIRFDRQPELTMLGRTYSIGYERDLDETLIERPKRTLLNPDWTWMVWYPLRRKGGFSQLPREQQMDILKEHGTIGMQFGAGDHGHDIRLACHGLDAADNDFVIGLTGKDLTPLSKLVETMRKTVQTSTWIEKLGPFFVGKKVWQSSD